MKRLHAGYPRGSRQSLRYGSRWTPGGDVGADDFWWQHNGHWVKQSPPDLNAPLAVSDAAI